MYDQDKGYCLKDLGRWIAKAEAWQAKADALEEELQKAKNDLWVLERKLALRDEAEALPPYYTHAVTCPSCGSEKISPMYEYAREPQVWGDHRHEGSAEHVDYLCSSCHYCGFPSTRTLEASR